MQTFIYPKFDQTAKAKIVERENLFKSSKQKNVKKIWKKKLQKNFETNFQ